MKKLFTLLLAAAFCTTFISCGDTQKTDETISNQALLGTWQHTWSKGYEKSTLYPERNDEWDSAIEDKEGMTFNADGSGKINVTNGEIFKWTLEGNVLTQTATDGDTQICKILSITKESLILEVADTYDDIEYYSVETFTKVK